MGRAGHAPRLGPEQVKRWAYYNDNDPYCCAWLRNLIAAGLIPDGEVDGRSIRLVQPYDLWGFAHVHLFAGIAGWPLALQIAGWDLDLPCWTASCPCQPLSGAGQGRGDADERHLWPAVYDLIAECRPDVLLGEQVASRLGLEWISGVQADLETLHFAVGVTVLPACAVGAPHRRERLWFVAHAQGDRLDGEWGECRKQAEPRERRGEPDHGGSDVAAPHRDGRHQGRTGDGPGQTGTRREDGAQPPRCGGAAHAGEPGLPAPEREALPRARRRDQGGATTERGGGRAGGVGDAQDLGSPPRHGGPGHNLGQGQPQRPNPWSGAEWLACADGRYRRVEPGIPLLAARVPHRVAKLRAIGNAIVPALAAEFVKAVMACRP